MNGTFQALLNTLSDMPNDALNRSAKRLARAEKRHAAELICHLAEISQRKVHLELGYANLFEYCVKRLGLSEGAVALRRQVANVARRFPRVLDAIAETRISLTVAAKVAPHLTDDNVARVLSDCAGMARREVEEYVVAFAPKSVFQSTVRRQSQRAAMPLAEAREETLDVTGPPDPDATNPAAPSTKSAPSRPSRAHDGALARPHGRPSARLEPARPEMFNFRFAANRRFKDAVVRLAEVMGLDPECDMVAIFERAVDVALDKTDPQRKFERRVERRRRKDQRPLAPQPITTRSSAMRSTATRSNATLSATGRSTSTGATGATARPSTTTRSTASHSHRPDDAVPASQPHGAARINTGCAAQLSATADTAVAETAHADMVAANTADTAIADTTADTATSGSAHADATASRHIPSEVRERVLFRAGQRCEYRGPSGRRCTCRTHLEIEHELPFAMVRCHTEHNLKAYCRNHNRFAAEQIFGAEFVAQKIEQQRARRRRRVLRN